MDFMILKFTQDSKNFSSNKKIKNLFFITCVSDVMPHLRHFVALRLHVQLLLADERSVQSVHRHHVRRPLPLRPARRQRVHDPILRPGLA